MISSNPTPTTPAHMETSRWLRNSFSGGNDGGGGGGDSGGHIGNLTNNNAWDNSSWDISTSTPVAAAANYRYDWTNLPRVSEASAIHALLFGHVTDNNAAAFRRGTPDPHMMCLKLGKRHYCDDAVVPDRHVLAAESSSAAKTKRHVTTMTTATHDAVATATTVAGRWPATVRVATRCQVEGCNVALGNVKEYYRRHKVCEIHSKAPEVVVSGLQQRFCQQCSRFHDVTEFDEAKRSCRRRLEGHNLRRRKGNISNSLPPNFPHSHENNPVMKRRLGPLSTLPSSESLSKPVRAFSLLSSPKPETWSSSDDLSSRCSAALYELIAANRSTSLHFINQNSSHQPTSDNTMHHTSHDTQAWDQFSHTTMTLDHKQAPALDFGLLPMKEESKDPEGWTDYCWSGFGGSNVV